jgi:hypothetical protein
VLRESPAPGAAGRRVDAWFRARAAVFFLSSFFELGTEIAIFTSEFLPTSTGAVTEAALFGGRLVTGETNMIDTLRESFPADMAHAAERPAMGDWEGMANDAIDWLKDQAREHPTSFGLWALGIGFVLGWKLKPW